MLFARGGHCPAGDPADHRANERAFATAGDAAKDCPEAGAAADLSRGPRPSPPPSTVAYSVATS